MNEISLIKSLSSENETLKKILVLNANTLLTLATTCILLNGLTNVACSQTKSLSTDNNSLLKQIDRYSGQNNIEDTTNFLNQVNNISQLRDVSPTDWSYEALKSLVNRYGCISGFPNQTYRGTQSLSRYEFAAGLNSCLNQIERLIATSKTLSGEDLDTIQRLNQEFTAELVTLSTRTNNLEAQIASLEDNQFSTTTKFIGEAVFSIGQVFTGESANGQELDSEVVFGNRSRLAFNTSFTGKDLLLAQFTAGNFPAFADVTGTFEGDLGLIADNGNDLNLLVALYSFPVGDHTNIVVEGSGGIAYDFADTINPLDFYNDSASGSISAFGVRNPIYNQVAGAGIGVRSQLSDSFELSAGYLAPSASNPEQANGLFNGAYAALGQVVFKPSDRFKLGLTYVNAYNQSDTFTGSNLANFNSFAANQVGETVPISSNSYGIETSLRISDRFIISGWGGYTKNSVRASITGNNGQSVSSGEQDIWNWAVTLAFPDLLREGNLGGIVIGMEPKVTSSNIDITGILENTNPDTSLHIEGFYQYQLSDNIAVTPGVVWITAPDHQSTNNDIIIGTLRTTFTF
jgi:Carbohydrate-selective porin, OprB family/S-layer homology domain